MANADQIKRGITALAGASALSARMWAIGITTDPGARRQELESPPLWMHWPADSLEDAKIVFAYFTRDMAMHADTGAENTPGKKAHVYIF